MKGSVQVKYGTWHTVISYKGSDGKYKKKWEATGLNERGNKKEATKILEERLQQFEEAQKQQKEKYNLRAKKAAAEPLGTADTRFVDYCKAYIEYNKKNLSPYVYNYYKKYYIRVFNIYFKDKTVIDITADEIEGFYKYCKEERGVNNNTLKHYANVLRPALKHAYKEDRIIPDNPYEDVQKIGKAKPVLGFYNKKELDVLFKNLQNHRICLAIKMLAHYGFRRSELLGLRWQSIDFDNNSITVNHKVIMIEKILETEDELKSTSSYRSLPLIPHIKEDLFKWQEQIEENKKFLGNSYIEQWKDYIFVDEKGELLKPDYLSHSFTKQLKKLGMKHIRLHDLRHSCASLLLANGIGLKQIQEWLGHADFVTTANHYAHLDFSGKQQSAKILTEAFGEKKQLEKEKSLSEVDILYTKILENMKQLGFDDYEEYAKFLDEKSETMKTEARLKTNFEM